LVIISCLIEEKRSADIHGMTLSYAKLTDLE